MTTPIERMRALHAAGEMLRDLLDADELEYERIPEVETILRHYPTPEEIEEWAAGDAPTPGAKQWLAPEDGKP